MPVGYQPSSFGSIPVVPPRRGAGFWVGITAAIATGVILALLAGFFIGRGTRLSNGDVQAKVTAQGQADQIAQQQALSAQKAADQKVLNRAVVVARHNGERAGLREGRIEGQQQGYQQGQSQGYQQGQAAGQAQGFQQGQSQGFQQGQSQGYSQGLTSGCAVSGFVC
jgi:flagellar biosynthesis/type III secretory pathway protein FliH